VVFDYYVCFDEEDTTVAGKARWGDLPTAAPPSTPTTARTCSNVAGRRRKKSSSAILSE
jgi:hypothetical protein